MVASGENRVYNLPMTKQGIAVLIFGILVIFGGAVFILARYQDSEPKSQTNITNFEECIAAGYPAMESYPRQCRVPGGKLFVEVITPEAPDPTPVVKGACYVGGCSGQVCSDQKDVASTCEFRAEYACYKTATCERQASGQCGWTQTAKLTSCISSAKSNGSEGGVY